MKNISKQSASLLTVAVVFGMFITVGLAVGGAVANAEWKGSGVPSLEAIGTVTYKGDAEAPAGPKGAGRIYLKVDFKLDDGTMFVIPFRHLDMEAIPVERGSYEETGGTWWQCGNGGCTQGGTPTVTKHPATLGHGVLRYHQCDGNFYCFDSFKETPTLTKK